MPLYSAEVTPGGGANMQNGAFQSTTVDPATIRWGTMMNRDCPGTVSLCILDLRQRPLLVGLCWSKSNSNEPIGTQRRPDSIACVLFDMHAVIYFEGKKLYSEARDSTAPVLVSIAVDSEGACFTVDTRPVPRDARAPKIWIPDGPIQFAVSTTTRGQCGALVSSPLYTDAVSEALEKVSELATDVRFNPRPSPVIENANANPNDADSRSEL